MGTSHGMVPEDQAATVYRPANSSSPPVLASSGSRAGSPHATVIENGASPGATVANGRPPSALGVSSTGTARMPAPSIAAERAGKLSGATFAEQYKQADASSQQPR